MKRLLITAAAIVTLITPATAMDQSVANANLVATVAMYREKCGTPPDAFAKAQLILIRKHDYTSAMEMDALIDVTLQLTKMTGGVKAWCSAMADSFKENTPTILDKLKAAK